MPDQVIAFQRHRKQLMGTWGKKYRSNSVGTKS